MDNQLRHILFQHYVDVECDYRTAAQVLAGMRMEGDDATSVYFTTPVEMTDVYVKIAECFLEEDDAVEADSFVTKAGASVELIGGGGGADDGGEAERKKHVPLILRYKSTYAKVLDANRRFLQAAGRYHELSQFGSTPNTTSDGGQDKKSADNDGDENSGDNDGQHVASVVVNSNDLLEFLGRAATCAILAPSSSQCQRILGLVSLLLLVTLLFFLYLISNDACDRRESRSFTTTDAYTYPPLATPPAFYPLTHTTTQVFKDERLSQLDAIPHFETHSAILTKMYMNQVIRHDNDLTTFDKSLCDHQRAIMGDGLTVIQRAIIEHNMVAVSHLYQTIYFDELAVLLDVSNERAETVAAKMIVDGSLKGGSIDQVEGMLVFDKMCSNGGGNTNGGANGLAAWDESITSFCVQLNRVTDAIRA